MTVTDVEPEILHSTKKQDNLSYWKPGQSGNPSGRSPIIKQIRDLARTHTEEAILGLLDVARDKQQTGSARVAAWEAILDRGWGKAPQKYEVEVSIFDSLSPEQRAVLDVALEMLLQRQTIDVTPKP